MGLTILKTAVTRFTSAVREEMTPVSTNFLTLDFLRFFAALIVVLYHYNQEIQTPQIALLIKHIVSNGHLFVDLFFVISGFIISYVYWGKISTTSEYGRFLIKRVARLWPLHILVLLAYLGIWGATTLADIPLRNPEKYDASCIVPQALMAHAMGICDGLSFNYVSWSISAEMGMYILTPLFFLIASRSLFSALVVSILASFLLIFLNFQNSPYLEWTFELGAVRAIPAFLFGIFLYQVRDRLGFIPAPHILMWGVFGLFFLIRYVVPDLSIYAYVCLMYAASLLAVAADQRGCVPIIIRKLAPLGNLTYGSYMLHPIISTVIFAFVVHQALGLTGLASDITILLMIPLTFIGAVLSLVLIETPCRRLISNIGRKGKNEIPSPENGKRGFMVSC